MILLSLTFLNMCTMFCDPISRISIFYPLSTSTSFFQASLSTSCLFLFWGRCLQMLCLHPCQSCIMSRSQCFLAHLSILWLSVFSLSSMVSPAFCSRCHLWLYIPLALILSTLTSDECLIYLLYLS